MVHGREDLLWREHAPPGRRQALQRDAAGALVQQDPVDEHEITAGAARDQVFRPNFLEQGSRHQYTIDRGASALIPAAPFDITV